MRASHYKNQGAIEATAEEREAIRAAFKDYPPTGANAADVKLVRDKLEPTLPAYDIAGARYFHIACDLLTIAYVWAKEWRREKPRTREIRRIPRCSEYKNDPTRRRCSSRANTR